MELAGYVNKKLAMDVKSVKKENTSKKQKKTCQPLDLNAVTELEAAKQRALHWSTTHVGLHSHPFPGFLRNRVFINDIDSFIGRHLGNLLCDQEFSGDNLVDSENKNSTEDEEIHEELIEDEELDLQLHGNIEQGVRENNTRKYEIIGSVGDSLQFKPIGDISEIIDPTKQELYISKILSCGFIIYNITQDMYCHPKQIEEASTVLESLVSQLQDLKTNFPKAFQTYSVVHTLVVISPLATWAKTKPIDPDDPELPFTEDDYRKRKPHPNYKKHCDFEKRVIEVGKLFPNNLRAVVVGTGVPYGYEEDILYFLFKMAWLNVAKLPIFKPGTNLVPLIHVESLASVVHRVMEDTDTTKYKYIVAVDQTPTSLKTLVKLINKEMGSGKCVWVDKEDAFLYEGIEQRNYDLLTLDLNIEPRYIVDIDMKWKTELTLVENMPQLIREFKLSRNLKPIKIFIHGPPASGTSIVARRLASHYSLHYLQEKEVIQAAIQNMKDKIEELKYKESIVEDAGSEEEDEEEDEEEVDEKDEETLTAFLKEVENSMRENNGRLDDHYVIRFFKERMLTNPCQNQGFVIDGYPNTLESTQELYGVDAEEEEEEERSNSERRREKEDHLYDHRIMPQYVESLDISDDALIRRMIALPEDALENTHVEEDMCRRLSDFRYTIG